MKSLLLIVCLFFPVFAEAFDRNPDTASVESIIAAFGASVIDKDKARFVKLFLHEDTAWQSVTGDANLRQIRRKQPDAPRVRINPKSSHLSFIDSIVADKERQEEKFRDVKIESDGDIASVWFDYSYQDGDKETNHGKEAWHLVRTDEGWKIVSVIWSVNWTPVQ
ncbi:SnoaL-like protein [Luteimonas cucumeris]|uniref:SnoaL-like protein n=1 Tax=Luteimonas cucumeris TaxID=985012 RepID=A0A562KVS2_9GAMM|nr:nuclear transport factor 2 family protein [Luteimonas cucumeris]TWH99385.1 SnoaL-like protein [Luteimonas cucumeris]